MAGILSYALKLDTSAFTGAMGNATGAVRGLAGAANSTAGAIAKLAAPLAALAGGFSAFKILEKAADMESLKVSFETVLGSAEAADSMLKKITATAAATPYGIEELAQASRRLLAVTDRNALVPTLRMIGDLASAAQVPIADLASMYAKIKGSDKIQGEDFEQLSNALPGSLQAFVKVLKVDSVAAVRKLGEEGRITGAALDQVFINLTTKGGMAFDGMNKQSQTTKGLLSTLSDAVSSLMVAIGTPVNDFLKPIIADNTARLEIFTIQFKAFLNLLKGASQQGQLGAFIGASLNVALIEAVNIFSAGIRGSVAYLGAALPGVFNAAVDELTQPRIVSFFENLFSGLGHILEANLKSVLADIMMTLGASGTAVRLMHDSLVARDKAPGELAAAKAAMEGGVLGDSAVRIAKALMAADKAGKAAYASAAANPLMDAAKAKAELAKVAGKISLQDANQLFNPQGPKADPADSAEVKAKGPVLRDKDNAAKAAKDALDFQKFNASWAMEGRILEARATGKRKIIALAEREVAIEKLKLELMDKAGLNDEQAAKIAKERVKLEEAAANPWKQKGVLSAAASDAKRAEQKALQDQKREFRRQGMSPAEIAKELARGAAAADPNRARRDAAAAAAEAAKKADARKLTLMEQINDKFGKLATA